MIIGDGPFVLAFFGVVSAPSSVEHLFVRVELDHHVIVGNGLVVLASIIKGDSLIDIGVDYGRGQNPTLRISPTDSRR